jgi:hypothetical protein
MSSSGAKGLKHLAGGRFVTDTDVKKAITPVL